MKEQELTKILDKIIAKFLIGVNKNVLEDCEKFYFILEEAYWYFIDFYPQHSSTKFKNFIEKLLERINLKEMSKDDLLSKFNKFKFNVQVFGALMLNTDLTHLLLVKGFSPKSKYTFPKGKQNIGETGFECTIREIYEEIGYKISKYENTFFFKIKNERYILFVVENVPIDYKFETKTRNEIKEIKWFSFNEISEKSKCLDDDLSQIRKNFSSIRGIISDLVKAKNILNKKNMDKIFEKYIL